MENNTMDDESNFVSVEQRVTRDLKQTEEAVFEVVALNPDASIEQIREKYNLSKEKILGVTDRLQSKGFIEQVEEDEFDDCVWRVTELGRLMLLKYYESMKFDVMEAKLRGQPRQQVEELESKREAFETAYWQCKTLFEEGGDL